ncbi:DUF2851 family protein [Cytophagales bacterium LB-30]|uniref:DUF2851 family protein n=1 Tax=Shiella aurantiaca TaxID=3058365 RepID=A0ABT8F1E6_9BACT|nr:DUF2851 family protein [Shiella aurantiaca]MDN4164281.1 DUF2851 family protein [Shiella aurantiaca]
MRISEDFLHFIWQYQYFDKTDLRTAEGEVLHIIHPGFHNTHAGPDFKEAKLRIGSVDWSGHVEIHVQAKEWQQHAHQTDKAYDSVVLHVVLQGTSATYRSDGSLVPCLVLNGRIAEDMLARYQDFDRNQAPIKCASQLTKVSSLVVLSEIEKRVIARLNRKSAAILEQIEEASGDWEEVTYRQLGKNFGFKVNEDPFVRLVHSIPYKLIAKYRGDARLLEALLLGQAGFLSGELNTDYLIGLQKEYEFLRHKHQLGAPLSKALWRFLRLRPANFPLLRIAQFAALLHKIPHLFAYCLESEPSLILKSLKEVKASPYWDTHYTLEEKSVVRVKKLGKSSIESLLINSVAPLLAAYAQHTQEEKWMEKAQDVLQELKAEENHILSHWWSAGIEAQSAFDSQGLIELMNEGCKKSACLRCGIGVSLLKPAK